MTNGVVTAGPDPASILSGTGDNPPPAPPAPPPPPPPAPPAPPAPEPPAPAGDPEDPLKAYKELQGQFTKVSQELATLKKGQQPAPAGDPPAPEGDPQNIDMDALQAEFIENGGSLKEETKAKVVDMLKGVFGDGAESMLDEFVKGRVEKAQAFTNSIYEMAGGEAHYGALIEWGKTNASPEEHAAFNAALDSGNVHAIQAQVQYMLQRMGAASPPNTTDGKATNGSAIAPFASQAEMIAAMDDPRYSDTLQQDPAYVAQIEARAKVSNF